MKNHLITILTTLALTSLLMLSCGKNDTDQSPSTDAVADTTEGSVREYSAMETDGIDSVSDITASPLESEKVGLFPMEHLVPESVEHTPQDYLGAKDFNDVLTAKYEINEREFTLFLTDDLTGMGFYRLSQFAASQSQVKPAPMEFDEGYGVWFHSRDHGWVLGGLKDGYLLGVVGYHSDIESFISHWVEAVKK